jgi:hypothetical protein
MIDFISFLGGVLFGILLTLVIILVMLYRRKM